MKDYSDIINLPHHVSENRPHMSLYDRAAQFSPFAALAGHEESVRETARLTSEKIIGDEAQKEVINRKLGIISDNLNEHPQITVVYYKPDERKSGGSYVTACGAAEKISADSLTLVLRNTEPINIEDIYDITGEIFNPLDDYDFI